MAGAVPARPSSSSLLHLPDAPSSSHDDLGLTYPPMFSLPGGHYSFDVLLENVAMPASGPAFLQTDRKPSRACTSSERWRPSVAFTNPDSPERFTGAAQGRCQLDIVRASS